MLWLQTTIYGRELSIQRSTRHWRSLNGTIFSFFWVSLEVKASLNSNKPSSVSTNKQGIDTPKKCVAFSLNSPAMLSFPSCLFKLSEFNRHWWDKIAAVGEFLRIEQICAVELSAFDGYRTSVLRRFLSTSFVSIRKLDAKLNLHLLMKKTHVNIDFQENNLLVVIATVKFSVRN